MVSGFVRVRDRGDAEIGKPISTIDRSALDESTFLSGYDPDGSFLRAFHQEARRVRRIGSAALNLCYLVSGTADAVWEHDTYPWDVAAGLPVAARPARPSPTSTASPTSSGPVPAGTNGRRYSGRTARSTTGWSSTSYGLS